jgi:hypothetical protein
MKKTERIKQLKRLLKKYHPDICGDERAEAMYNEITRKLTGILNNLKANENSKIIQASEKIHVENIANTLSKIKGQDYVYYKLGVKYYKNIHPNQFYRHNFDKTYETKAYGELVSALNNIFISFNLAEYYFRKVIEEYPQSPWLGDAADKIKLLKKLYRSYKNMVLEENKIATYKQYITEMGLRIL